MLHRALFGDPPRAEALIAEHDGRPVGFALFFATFSTWECRQGIWLEDLYVEEAARGSGAGRALLARLAELTIERGGARLEWFSDETNLPALAFYEHLGAERRSRSELHRLDGEALRRVAGLT